MATFAKPENALKRAEGLYHPCDAFERALLDYFLSLVLFRLGVVIRDGVC